MRVDQHGVKVVTRRKVAEIATPVFVKQLGARPLGLPFAPGYTTLDGLVSYAWDRFRVSLNGYNLSDETYYAQVHGNRVTPGQGRTFIATLGVVY